MEIALGIIAGLLVVAGIGCGLLWRHRGRLQHENANLRNANQQLDKDLAVLRQRHDDDERRLNEFKDQIDNHLKAIAGQTLKESRDEFLKQANAKLQPMADLLKQYDQQYRQIEQSRKTEYGGLEKVTSQLKDQTESLVTALRRPEVRGRWGEIALRRIVELAGLTERCDFDEQATLETDEGRLRPDMIVRLPSERTIVVDSKIVLDPFMEVVSLPPGDERTAKLRRHVDQINEQVRRLSSKAYLATQPRTPDFVVLFLPIESALYAAVEVEAGLLEQAMSRKIVIATPTLLIALLKAVEIGWREQQIADNAQRIRDLGQELHDRLSKALGDVTKVGASLSTVIRHYNELVGSLQSRVLPSARRFEELGAKSPRALPEDVPTIEVLPRRPQAVESAEDDDELAS